MEVRDPVAMPFHDGARVLKIEMIGQVPRIWSLCDTEAPIAICTLRVFAGDAAIPDAILAPNGTLGLKDGSQLNYLGSFVLDHVAYHVFDQVTPEPSAFAAMFRRDLTLHG
jgi:hypothetical protein